MTDKLQQEIDRALGAVVEALWRGVNFPSIDLKRFLRVKIKPLNTWGTE